MKRLFRFIRNHYQQIFKGFLFAAAVAMLVWIFPKEGKFKYEFDRGKPWVHEDLYAPFDFAIVKPAEVVEAEKLEATSNLPYYFRFEPVDSLVLSELLEKQLLEQWDVRGTDSIQNMKWKGLNLEALRKVAFALNEEGVLDMVPEIEGLLPDHPAVVIKRNLAEDKEFGEIMHLSDAYRFIQHKLDSIPGIDASLLSSILIRNLQQNIIFDAEKTNIERKAVADAISPTYGMVQEGERIISKGEIVDQNRYLELVSLRSNYEEDLGGADTFYMILFGQIVLITISIAVLLLFLLFFTREVLTDNRKIILILLVIILLTLITSLTLSINPAYLYLVPICLVPIIIRAFFDTRMALYVYLITIIILGFLVPNSFEFIFLQLLAGVIAIMSVANLQRRSQFFVTSVWIFLTYALLYFGLTLIREGTWREIDPVMFAMFAGSAVLTLFSYPLIYMFEKLFGFITDVTLVELSNTNNKLLRELSMKAPGTFQHSLQVANLAEDAIYQIGGNALLVRTGALYHDIGKMDMPMYFVENQATGVNPHDDLTNEESARIIISHVIKGIEKAKKHKLPEQIIDFIRTHHGTRKVDYFYTMQMKNNPDEDIDEADYTYPGPIPYSKETAVVMMADSVEAASRSLRSPNAESLNALVDKIIDRQMETGQFVNADITFKDISMIRKLFKKRLMTIFHVRIEYPE